MAALLLAGAVQVTVALPVAMVGTVETVLYTKTESGQTARQWHTSSSG